MVVVVARTVLLEERGDPATKTAALKIRTAAERCARIVRTFLAMARQQPCLRRKGQHLGADRIELAPPVREPVSARNGACCGDDITGERGVEFLAVQHH